MDRRQHLNILTGRVTGNLQKGSGYDKAKQIKLIDHFAKVNDNYTVTKCQNGYVVDVSGQDYSEEWINAKFVFKTIDKLKELFRIWRGCRGLDLKGF